MGTEATSGHHVPPFEGKGLTADVGAAVDIAGEDVVGEIVVDEGAGEAQGLQQCPHPLLQAALPTHQWSEGFGDAQVSAQHQHVHLQHRDAGKSANPTPKIHIPPGGGC